MAVKTQKQPIQAITQPESSAAPDLDIEDAIADELLDNIDWSKVRSAILKKAPAKLFAWLCSANDRPINISAFPELSALPSADDEVAA